MKASIFNMIDAESTKVPSDITMLRLEILTWLEMLSRGTTLAEIITSMPESIPENDLVTAVRSLVLDGKVEAWSANSSGLGKDTLIRLPEWW